MLVNENYSFIHSLRLPPILAVRMEPVRTGHRSGSQDSGNQTNGLRRQGCCDRDCPPVVQPKSLQPFGLTKRHCPGQFRATTISELVIYIGEGQSAEIGWVKGHSGIPGNERADALAGKAAENVSWSAVTSVACLRLRISEKFRTAKEK
jgi:hypothetical protein